MYRQSSQMLLFLKLFPEGKGEDEGTPENKSCQWSSRNPSVRQATNKNSLKRMGMKMLANQH
jgi:hypothetical protein